MLLDVVYVITVENMEPEQREEFDSALDGFDTGADEQAVATRKRFAIEHGEHTD